MKVIYGITVIDSSVGMYANDGRYRESETVLFLSNTDRDHYAIDWIKSYAKDLPDGHDCFDNTLEDFIKDYYETGCCTINCDDYHITFESFLNYL